ncbi:MAG: hypothetical protein IJT82_09770 [Schwartzia sp.]|nr:hypothetical protein [Schwartzia sp. (in: firmicutes)]
MFTIKIISYIIIVPLIIVFLREAIYQVLKLNYERKLIDRYEHDVENPELIDKMFEYCLNDRKLKKIMSKHEATEEDFDLIYHKLLIRCNFRKINRFVPINAFFSVKTLDYCLANKEKDELTLAKTVLNFFHI